MKIKSIHIYNIASIVDETIDFTKQPLSDSDVFLITGNMGSGKTTILDSICLALYNTTPRLNDRKRETVENNQDNLTLNDPRNLMRRNTGEALVELLFTGVDGNDYEAVWQVQRGKRKKADAQLGNVNWSLKNVSTNQVITASNTRNYGDVESAIQNAVGLDFNQFCRTTMLAQGEFTRFLKSDENEKAEILEKLTKFTEYTRAGELIHEITQQKRTDWETIREKASDTGLTDTEIQEKKDAIQKLQEELVAIKLLRNDFDKKHKWLQKENDLLSAKIKAENEAKDAYMALDSQEYKDGLLMVEQWNASIDARGWMKKIREAESRIRDNEDRLSKAETEFRQILAGLNFLLADKEDTNTSIQRIKMSLESQADKIDVYAHAQAIKGYIDAIGAARKTIADNDTRIKTRTETLEKNLKPKANAAATDFSESVDKAKRLSAKIEENETALQKLNLNALRGQQNKTTTLIRNIDDAAKAIDAINKAQEKYDIETDSIKKLQTEVDNKQKQLDEVIIPEYNTAKTEKDTAERILDILKDSVDKYAKQIRSHLVVGCKCPVCQKEVEALPDEKDLDTTFAKADEELTKAKRRYEAAEKDKNRLVAEIKADTKSLQTRIEAHKKDDTVKQAKENALTTCLKCGISEINKDTLSQLESLKSEKNDLSAALQNEIKKGEDIENVLKNLRKQKKDIENEVDTKRKAEQLANEAVAKCTSEIESLKAVNQQKTTDIQTNEDASSSLLAGTTWLHDWKSDGEAFVKELTTAADAYNKEVKDKADAESYITTVSTTIANVQETVDRILLAYELWKNVNTTEKTAIPQIMNKATSVLTTVTTCAGELSTSKQDLESVSPKFNSYLEGHSGISLERLNVLEEYGSDAISAKSTSLESIRSMKKTKEELWNKAQQDYQAHQTLKPAIGEGDSLEELTKSIADCEQKNQDKNQEIGSINKILSEDQVKKGALEDLRQKADQAGKEYAKWQHLNSLIGDANGTKFQKIAQSFILGGLLDSANAYLKRLNPRYSLKAVPATLHISLEDAYQGFATRSTDSLSGGEGFLVSLALALALSDIGQSLAVDTLFIDEGFGTLSGIPLTNAINTLRSLHSQSGRHVGIISHIKEISESIPVQIQVIQSGSTSSSRIEIFPKPN